MENKILVACLAMTLFGCSNEKPTSSANEQLIEGGYIRTNEVEHFKTLMPLAIDEINNYHITTQIYEGLVRFDKDLHVIPAIAHAWEISPDLLTYTFHLREGVKFQEDDCFAKDQVRLVKANDVKYCFEQLCSNIPDNRQFAVTFKDRVLGANAYFNKETKELEGLKILNDSTIQIILERPDANFLNVLTMAGCYIYPKEAVEKYGEGMKTHCVGTGPFQIARLVDRQIIVLKKNRDYWGKDQEGRALPYLDSICWYFLGDRSVELDKFKRGQLDLIYRVPASQLQSVFSDEEADQRKVNFDVFSSPALSTHFYGFNLMASPNFSSALVRKAINLAIDQNELFKSVMKGEGMQAEYGIVPYYNIFEQQGYNYKALKGSTFDPDSARKLMAKAGYNDKHKMPPLTLDVNDGGAGRNLMLAVKVQNMLKKNLDIDLNLNVIPWPEHMENVQNGTSEFFRYAWVSDYADPESFLEMFYGKHVPKNQAGRSYVNLMRFKNARFDSLFETARATADQKKRYELLSMAEQVVLDEAAVVPLFYDENVRVVRKNIRNQMENPLNYIDFRTTYFVK